MASGHSSITPLVGIASSALQTLAPPNPPFSSHRRINELMPQIEQNSSNLKFSNWIDWDNELQT